MVAGETLSKPSACVPAGREKMARHHDILLKALACEAPFPPLRHVGFRR